VGARQSFFDLGGNSLLAAHVVLDIEQVTGKRLPLGALIQAPTIEALAALLRGPERPTLPPHIVALRNTGSTPPFFCMPGLGGSVLTLRQLVHHMDPDQVIYALEAAGLDGGDPPGQSGVEKLAAQYIEEIRAVQPEGPYFLGGLSFGGKVVFEIARQLHAQGQEVAFLALIDSYGPGYFGPRALVERISYHAGILTRLRRDEWLPYLRDRARSVKNRLASLRSGSTDESTADPPYQPGTYRGKVTVFRARRQPPDCTRDPFMGWGGVAAGGLEVRHIEGDHWSIAHANARELAEDLMTNLIKAQTR
jgi:thioesterase domain-containing protein